MSEGKEDDAPVFGGPKANIFPTEVAYEGKEEEGKPKHVESKLDLRIGQRVALKHSQRVEDVDFTLNGGHSPQPMPDSVDLSAVMSEVTRRSGMSRRKVWSKHFGSKESKAVIQDSCTYFLLLQRDKGFTLHDCYTYHACNSHPWPTP